MSTQPGMVSVSPAWFEEHFKCCICLDIYRDPVSTPCGHNFCLDCIEGFWETKHRPECPLCKATFSSRPDLRINHGLAEILRYLRSMSEPGVGDVDPPHISPSDEVLCDVCHDPRVGAVRSCLVCQASYCELHLGPHLRDDVLQKHQLTDPATFGSSHLCHKHNKPLEMFCKKEQTPVCASCCLWGHKQHPTVSIDRASKKAKASLKETKADILKMIQARMRKTEEIQKTVDASKKMTEREIQTSVQVSTALISAVEQQQAAVVEELQRRQEEVERKAEELLHELQAEMKELQAQGSEIHNLQNTRNHLHLLQSFSSLRKLPPTRDWSEVKVYPDNGMGAIREAVETMKEICQKFSKKLVEEELDKMSEYATNVTYDSETASGWLEISADGKKVNYCKKKLPVTDNPKRFDSCVCVLGKENFNSGRHYWVVELGDKTDWDLGLARESVQRKGSIVVRPETGFWSICRRRSSLTICAAPAVPLQQEPAPQKVGVFVDYALGLVSFYDAGRKRHIHSFTDCEFSGAVFPYFNPCVQDNGKAAPLVIRDVEGRGAKTGSDLIMRTSL